MHWKFLFRRSVSGFRSRKDLYNLSFLILTESACFKDAFPPIVIRPLLFVLDTDAAWNERSLSTVAFAFEASGAGILLSLASVGLMELSACALCYRQSESSAWDWPRADNDYCSIGRILACYSHSMLEALKCVPPPSLSCMTSEGLLWLLCSATEGCPEACI